MNVWQLQEAKAHLSKVIKEATKHGPQEITLRGEPVVVILSIKDYEKLSNPKPSFVEFMRQSPLTTVKIHIKRDPSLAREIDI